MEDSTREFLTGFALIALAIESTREKTTGDLNVLINAVRELSRPGSGPTLTHSSSGSRATAGTERPPYAALAANAVALADACIVELDRDLDAEAWTGGSR